MPPRLWALIEGHLQLGWLGTNRSILCHNSAELALGTRHNPLNGRKTHVTRYEYQLISLLQLLQLNRSDLCQHILHAPCITNLHIESLCHHCHFTHGQSWCFELRRYLLHLPMADKASDMGVGVVVEKREPSHKRVIFT